MNDQNIVNQRIIESISVKSRLLEDTDLLAKILMVSELCITSFQKGNKVLFAGNGGSAADAQHLAAELSGRYLYDRPPLYAEALHVNTSYITAVANDYSFSLVYSRLVEAFGKEGDILILLSTSGNSANILEAARKAKEKKMIVIGMTGFGGGKLASFTDVLIAVPSDQTPRIQECHALIGHIFCEMIESRLFPRTAHFI